MCVDTNSKRLIYGRRKGPRLSARQNRLVQNLLPDLRITPRGGAATAFNSLFPSSIQGVWLEVGFGAGEHIAWQAEVNPDIGIIGCEPFINGIAKLLTRIEEKNLKNIRIYDNDARHILDWLPDQSLDRIFVLFPDPWPKKRHHKRRFISSETLDLLARAMKNGAEFRFASDSGDYIRATLFAVRNHKDFEWRDSRPSDWREHKHDWPGTRYEQKAIDEGRRPYFLTFIRK